MASENGPDQGDWYQFPFKTLGIYLNNIEEQSF